MGAVLSQVDELGEEHPIAYLSRKLLPNEAKWDIWELELAAVVWATAACKHYLAGTPCELVTDSRIVSTLINKDVPNRRANWVIRLTEFDLLVTHRKGEENRNADFFSRWITEPAERYDTWENSQRLNLAEKTTFDEKTLQIANFEEEKAASLRKKNFWEFIKSKQDEDSWIQKLKAERLDKPHSGYTLHEGVLLFRQSTTLSKYIPPTEVSAIVVPKTLKKAVLNMFHGNDSILGHLGWFKTFHAIRERFAWKGLTRDVKRWIRSCQHCLSRKAVPPPHRRYNISDQIMAPMNRIAMDIVGPLKKTKRGNTHILTMFCPFSHWPEAFALSSTTAKDVLTCLKKHIAMHSVPAEVLSDRGTNFMAKKVHDFLSSMGSYYKHTSPYKPSSNGSVEGFHSYLAKALSAVISPNHDDWDEHLESVLFAYRATPMDALGMSPFEVIYGRKPNLPIDCIIGREMTDQPIDSVEDHRKMILNKARTSFPAIRQEKTDRHRQNQQSDRDIKNKKFSVGQKVYLHFPKGRFRPIDGVTKFSKVNDGPYTILDQRSNGLVFRVRNDRTGFVSSVFVGRMIPSEEWVHNASDMDFPIPRPIEQAPPPPPIAIPIQEAKVEVCEQAESGANDFVFPEEPVEMEVEEESVKWLPPPPPAKKQQPQKRRGRPKKQAPTGPSVESASLYERAYNTTSRMRAKKVHLMVEDPVVTLSQADINVNSSVRRAQTFTIHI
jgi:hypothetical protein